MPIPWAAYSNDEIAASVTVLGKVHHDLTLCDFDPVHHDSGVVRSCQHIVNEMLRANEEMVRRTTEVNE